MRIFQNSSNKVIGLRVNCMQRQITRAIRLTSFARIPPSVELRIARYRYNAEPTPLSSTVIDRLLKAQPARVPKIQQQS